MAKRRRDGNRIEDVAAAAGVSAMTVSRALRGMEGVSEARRAEILRLATAMNYVPDSSARSLAMANSTLIGISLPNLFNEVFADILAAMRDIFRSAGFSTVIETTDYDTGTERDWVERLLSWRPAGIILTGTDHDPDLRARLRGARVPVLEIWDHSDDPIDISVGIDHLAAGRALGDHAVSLGYARPAFLGAPEGFDKRADARMEGVRLAFGLAHLPAARPHETNSFEAGRIGTLHLLADPAARPDVIFCLNDHHAFGCMMTAQGLGLDVPGDIGVVGFNALGLTNVLPQALTTMRTPRRQMGTLGARHLLARIHGAKVARATCLPCTLQPGATLRPR
ncbi:MAG: LacI family DNA-binding transcriptional regulator [Pseudorhodobacter sp.]